MLQTNPIGHAGQVLQEMLSIPLPIVKRFIDISWDSQGTSYPLIRIKTAYWGYMDSGT